MSNTGTMAERSAKRKASALFDKTVQRQLETDRRVEEQRLADKQLVAKTERLRALRLARDELVAREEAERVAAEAPAKPRKKKAPKA